MHSTEAAKKHQKHFELQSFTFATVNEHFEREKQIPSSSVQTTMPVPEVWRSVL